MTRIVVVGLGYVGAPLAVALSRHFDVTGYDIDAERVAQLKAGHDKTFEIAPDLLNSSRAQWTTSSECIGDADIVMVTVPTPVDEFRVPNLDAVKAATKTIGQKLRRGATVVYESTVYPGVTESICAPLIASSSGLGYPEDFSVAYSPERINPGDQKHTLTNTIKIISADRPETLNLLDRIYGRITQVYKASSIKIAEAAKVLENTQRDINIALMNELSQIFCSLGIDTHDVIDAACSKWNFLDFRPGLVGGHCISVDPYYLIHKAVSHGVMADFMRSARRVNESMAGFITQQLIMRMMQRRLLHRDSRVTVLGISFKEDVCDVRNSGAVEICQQLINMGIEVQVIDPLADPVLVDREYGLKLITPSSAKPADAIVVAVAHAAFRKEGWALVQGLARNDQPALVADVKGVLCRGQRPEHMDHWRL